MATENLTPDVIRVPADRAPSILNNEAFTGAIIGDAIAGQDNGIGGALVGGAIGGIIGKERMERESEHGKLVRKPGTTAGSILAGAVLGVALLGVLAVLAPVATPIALAIAGGGAVVGGLMGYANHASAQHEYDRATEYYTKNGNYQGRAKEEQAYKVSPAEYKELEARLAAVEKREQALRDQGQPLQR